MADVIYIVNQYGADITLKYVGQEPNYFAGCTQGVSPFVFDINGYADNGQNPGWAMLSVSPRDPMTFSIYRSNMQELVTVTKGVVTSGNCKITQDYKPHLYIFTILPA